MSKKVRPYLQGQLDGLCGVYAIVNALCILKRVNNGDEATEAFNMIVTELEFLCPLTERIFEGTDIGEIDAVMKRVVKRHYGVGISTPFRSRCAQVTLKSFVLETRCFLREHQGVIFTSIGGFHDHWTLIRGVTRQTFLLFDSDRIHRLSFKNTVVSRRKPEGTKRFHLLSPYDTHFLWVE